jgi:O-antigen chain-terminating methyltransferase
VAAIGTVNPRPPGFKNNLVQKWKRLVARVLDWHVREQVEFNRAQMHCVQAVLEALTEHNRALQQIAEAMDRCLARIEQAEQIPGRLKDAEDRVGYLEKQASTLKERAQELADIRMHWQEWRKEWERKLAVNEMQFLRSVADLQSGFTHRSTQMESNFRGIAESQHRDFEGALARANDEIQRRLWKDLDRIRTEYESLIHHELRAMRQKAFAARGSMPAPAHAEPRHPYDFLHFAHKFRGPEEYVRNNYAVYLSYFRGRRKIADLGCGRGEMLEYLSEQEMEALGVDNDKESVALCRSKGLKVEEQDLFRWLESQPDSEWDAFFCGQVIEHLPPPALPGFLGLCASKLCKGGVLILETPNPQCLAIFASHFYLDPTHQRPVPPALSAFLMEEAGFGRLEIKRLAPAIESMPSLASLPEDFREAFFGCLDYAIIGVKL